MAVQSADRDAELVARAAAGDASAFDSLFSAHYRRVYNFAMRLTGNPDAAEDIAQTTFVRAYGSIGRLRDGRTFQKLLYRITVNLVRDRARTAQRKPWLSFLDLRRASEGRDGAAGDEHPELADGGLDPARIVGRSAFSDALAAQIAALPIDFREALVLHHVEGLDIREVAELTGVPEGTVKSRIGRARQRLQKAMAPWTNDEV